MLCTLVTKFKKHNITDKSVEDEQVLEKPKEKQQQLRKSARLNAQKSSLHDSGTESDDDELERLETERHADVAKKDFGDFLNSRSPPILASSPLLESEDQTESLDSSGAESGITAGCDSNECSNDYEPVKRGAFHRTSYTKSQCEFPPMSMHNTGDKRRYSMIGKRPDQPIASRLRSNNDLPRDIIIAARRTPVKLLYNKVDVEVHHLPGGNRPVNISHLKKVEDEIPSLSPPHYPVAKRGRTNTYGRPSLDLDKMLEHRFSSESFVPVGDALDETTSYKNDWALPACQHGVQHAVCAQPDCHFRQVFL